MTRDTGSTALLANRVSFVTLIPGVDMRAVVGLGLISFGFAAAASAAPDIRTELDSLADAIESKVIEWRRDIHQNPELGNREFRTSALVADHLKKLGMEVRTGVAHTGVVAVLKGGKPGPVIALRADMDALPVTEEVDLPFASKAKGNYEGKEVGVMHACGHDAHVAIMMGVAESLAKVKDRLPGTVKFLFQPAEESPPPGEEGGAPMMVKEGALESPRPDAVFGLHVSARGTVGKVAVRPGPLMASMDILRINVTGRQTHGAAPWGGVDPIVVSSQIVMALQTIVSRNLDITREPAVVTIGSIHGGNRFNIIPDKVELVGTIRTFDEKMREDIHARVQKIAESIAVSAGAVAEVKIDKAFPVVINNLDLTDRMLPTLKRVAGDKNVENANKVTGSEDFAVFAREVPGLYYFIGITPPDKDAARVAFNHSPRFYIDESGLKLGVRTMLHLTADFLGAK